MQNMNVVEKWNRKININKLIMLEVFSKNNWIFRFNLHSMTFRTNTVYTNTLITYFYIELIPLYIFDYVNFY